MKHFLTLLLILVLCSGILAGCKGTEQSATTAPANSSTAENTPTQKPTNTPKLTIPPEPTEFASKVEELEYRLTVSMLTDPVFEYCPEYDPAGYPNIKAIWFTGAKYGDKDTKVFAYIGFPSNASAENPVPAVVLMHGGGGYAFPEWVKIWNNRGYAAIAVGNTGYFPAKEGITNFYEASNWTRRVPKDVSEKDPRILPPDNDSMTSSKRDLTKQWMYHAVSQAIIANNILRNDERVDESKVGITGISWGSVITSITNGYDDRFAFAVPVYAGGYLSEALTWIKGNFSMKETQELWGAENRFNKVKMPVLFLTGATDPAFSPDTVDRSYADVENAVLAIQHGMVHGHSQGWDPPEIYRFADSVVKGKEGLITPKAQPTASMGRNVSFEINVPQDADEVQVVAYYINQPMSYSPSSQIQQVWKPQAGQYSNGTASVTLPDEAVMYFVELTVKVGTTRCTSSTRIVTIGG